ncbi:DUF6895 family protein [Streptomyces fuscigenes]|uniref:DUF6895 family protein n=1 Tax=Streptomyces fuscigenes TaxID=1528880 RepID=UPI001F1FA4CC|nr:hypothetical protein [Streptomyces fuscigenes]MCF3964270.1 hypothetical protein [Streptomyces fuscigenes]
MTDGNPVRGTGTTPTPGGPGATAPRAATALVHTVGARAIEWLYAHRAGFRLEPDVDPEIGFLERFKPIGELAVIGGVLFREGATGSRHTDLVRRLLNHVWHEVLDSGHMLVRAQHTEPISPVPFEVYLPFRELGYADPAVERAVTANQRLAGWHAFEVKPVRRLGLTAFLRRHAAIAAAGAPAGTPPAAPAPTHTAAGNGAPDSRDLSADLRRTWLAARPEPWTVEGHIAYDITHTVFHLTEWGGDPGGLPADLADYLAAWLPAWLDDWLDLERWDLLGELLVVDACLPAPTLDARAWEGFAAAQQEDGAMPALRGMPGGGADELFDAVYHPTLVAAFASTLATSRALTELSGPPEPAGAPT